MRHKFVAPSQPPPTPLTTPQQDTDSVPSSSIYDIDKQPSQEQQQIVIDTVQVESQTPLSQEVETEKEKQRKFEIEQRLMEKKAKQEKKTRKLFT
jgi:hypothetical protein